jgi:cell division protease FtsH
LIFLGRQISEQRNYSEEVAEQIDIEVRQLVDEAHIRALQLLRDNIDTLRLIATRLMEEETLEAAEFAAVFQDGREGDKQQEGAPVPGTVGKDTPPRVVPPSAAPQPI